MYRPLGYYRIIADNHKFTFSTTNYTNCTNYFYFCELYELHELLVGKTYLHCLHHLHHLHLAPVLECINMHFEMNIYAKIQLESPFC